MAAPPLHSLQCIYVERGREPRARKKLVLLEKAERRRARMREDFMSTEKKRARERERGERGKKKYAAARG